MVNVESKVGTWWERENVLPQNDKLKSVRCEGDDGDGIGDHYECDEVRDDYEFDGQKQK